MIQVMHPRLSSKNFKLPQEIQSTLRGKVSNYCRAPIIFGDFLKRLMSFFGCLNKSPSHKSAYKNQIFIKKIHGVAQFLIALVLVSDCVSSEIEESLLSDIWSVRQEVNYRTYPGLAGTPAERVSFWASKLNVKNAAWYIDALQSEILQLSPGFAKTDPTLSDVVVNWDSYSLIPEAQRFKYSEWRPSGPNGNLTNADISTLRGVAASLQIAVKQLRFKYKEMCKMQRTQWSFGSEEISFKSPLAPVVPVRSASLFEDSKFTTGFIFTTYTSNMWTAHLVSFISLSNFITRQTRGLPLSGPREIDGLNSAVKFTTLFNRQATRMRTSFAKYAIGYNNGKIIPVIEEGLLYGCHANGTQEWGYLMNDVPDLSMEIKIYTKEKRSMTKGSEIVSNTDYGFKLNAISYPYQGRMQIKSELIDPEFNPPPEEVYLERGDGGNYDIGIPWAGRVEVTGRYVIDFSTSNSSSPPPAGCSVRLTSGPAGEPLAPSLSTPRRSFNSQGSVLEVATGHYTHFAIDWKTESASNGCVPCGSGARGPSDTLSLIRIHKPGFEAFPSTLGNGVFYGSDVTLMAVPTGGHLIHDPTHYELLRYDTALWMRSRSDLPPLRFTDANGTTVSGPVDGGRAILTHAGLGRRIFECWSPGIIDPFGGLVPVGRLIREEDRQGNGWTHTYKTGAGVSRFIRGASEDQFGNRIVFTYSNNPTTGLPERMVKARLPDGIHDIEYTYLGSQLSQVRYPNGDVSRFEGFNGTGTYRIDDVGAEGTHRRKTVTLQVSGSQLPDVLEEQSRRAQMAGVNWINDNQLVQDVKLTSLRTGTDEVALSRLETAQADGIEVEAVTGASRIKMRLDANRFPQETSVLNGAAWELEESYLGMGRRVAKTTDASGRTTWHLPDTNGWVNREVRPNGAITTTQRGPGGVPLSVIDGLGRTATSTYDANGNRLTHTQASGTSLAATTTWTYNTRGQPLTMTDPLGNVTTYEYDPRGYLVAERLPSVPGQPEAIKRFAFNTAGQLAQSTDPEGRTATYGYDLRGRHVSTTYADGTSETTTYGSGQDANLVVARTNRNGVVTTSSYDAAGRQIAIVEAAGTSVAAVTTITYVPGTTLEATRTTDATVTTTTYDAYQRPSVTTVQPRSDLTLSTQTFYDAAGQMVRRLDPYGRNAYVVYDVNGREIRQVTELVPGGVTNPATVSTLVRSTATNPAFTIQDQEWDAEGQLLARVDGRGVRTSFAYDVLGRMTSQTQAVGTAEAATTTWTYDLAGRRLTETTPGGTVTAWAYDARGQEISRTEGVGTAVEATTAVAYTPTGKVAAVTDALGRTSVSAYGVCCDRLVSATDAAGFNTTFGYDAVGNRTSVTDPNGLTTSTAYDALNRPVSITDGAGGRTSLTYLNRATNLPTSGVVLPGVAWPTLLNTLKLSGSSRGSATVMTDPVGTKSVEVRDGLGRPVARINALGQTTLLAYDTVVNGLVESTVTDPTAAVTRARADGAGQVREQVDALGALTTLTYDAAGNRRSVRNAVQVGQDWTYDLQGRRLTEADTAGGHTGTQYHADGQVASVTNGMNEVTRFFYDARGRKTSEQDPVNGITTFAYDAVGNLLSITDAQGGVTRYRYDALNRLTREDFPGPTGGMRVYTYDAGGRLSGRSERLAAPGGE